MSTPEPTLYRLLIRWPLCAAIVLLLGMGIFSKRGWLDWRRMVRQNSELEAKIVLAQTTKEQLELQIHRLQSDATEQERVIRSVLGYLKPNETIVEFE